MRFFVANDFVTPSPDVALVALSASLKTQMSVLSQTATLRRGKVVQMKLGPVSTPASTDCSIRWIVNRQSAADGTGAGTATPNFMGVVEGGSAPTSGMLWKVNYSTEPTYASAIWTQYLNQHSGFVWYAPDELGLPWPATNNAGLAFSASSSNYVGTAVWGVDTEE